MNTSKIEIEIQAKLDATIQCPECKSYLRFVGGGAGFSIFTCDKCKYNLTVTMEVEWRCDKK